jgi:radical SAM superfamily enzyme YgiQ (UPF0313 family)
LIIKIKDGLASISDGVRVLLVDRSGRLMIYSNGKETFRRSLFNQFLKVGYKNGNRTIKVLSEKEAQNITKEAYDFLREVKNDLNYFIPNLENLNWEFLYKDSIELLKIYRGPVPIVPPDQYFPVYVQITVGCAWNRCTFCNLYKNQLYKVIEECELISMIKSLIKYFGPSLPSRKSVFLGDANSLLIDHEHLVKYFKIISGIFKLPIYSFVDAFLTQKRLKEDTLFNLKRFGLKRVYFGVESGSESVLKLLNKPMNVNTALEFIKQFKKAGISVGLIFLAGAGGKKFWEEHVKRSAEFVSRLELDRNDIIYVSPLHEYRDLPYWETVKETGKLGFKEKLEQFKELKLKIKDEYFKVKGKELQAPVVLYDIRESIY